MKDIMTFAAFCGSRCKSKCGASTDLMTVSGLSCENSLLHDEASSLSWVASKYISGAVVRRRSSRASQSNTSSTRPLNTSELTLCNAWRNFWRRSGGAFGPRRKYSTIVRGGFSRKSQGFASPFTIPDQRRTGLLTNPAQIMTATRFCALVAAYQRASGVENDSATEHEPLRLRNG